MSDLKIIVAYSSVAHITFMFYVIILGYIVGISGRILIIFYHGVVSSLMFWMIGILGWIKTRSLIVTKLISFRNLLMIVVFLVLVLNMAFPPFIGFIREILMLKSVLAIGKLVIFFAIIGVLLSCYYNVYIY